METDLKDFFEKIEQIKLQEKGLSFEKDKEIIKNQSFDEDEKEGEQILNIILEDLNKNIFINIKEEDKNQMACREILEILRYQRSHKNIRGVVSPFKPLFQPKKVSMVGKVFFNSTTDNVDNKTRENSILNEHNNGKKVN